MRGIFQDIYALIDPILDKIIETTNVSYAQLKKINTGLTIIMAFLGIYLVVTPYLPNLTFFLRQQNFKESDETSAKSDGGNFLVEDDFVPISNTLVIPKINLTQQIYSGTSSDILQKGIWRLPTGQDPLSGGNTVLTAHRFQYKPNTTTFYHLDKVEVGDEVSVYWEDLLGRMREYKYEVFEITEVPPTAIEIEKNTDEDILTLYTCTPLITAHNRLVVKAKLLSWERI